MTLEQANRHSYFCQIDNSVVSGVDHLILVSIGIARLRHKDWISSLLQEVQKGNRNLLNLRKAIARHKKYPPTGLYLFTHVCMCV